MMKRVIGWMAMMLFWGQAVVATERSSVLIEDLTWTEAEEALQEYDVVLLPVGARTKQHGPHLRLNNDYVMTERLKELIIRRSSVAVMPTLQYGFFPAFGEYAGSVSLEYETFKKTVIEICTSISAHGPKKFYVLNLGVSTIFPLGEAKQFLEENGIILSYLDIREVNKRLPKDFLKQEGGGHADEAETSMMLYLAPEQVDMKKAVKDYDPRPNRRGMTRDPKGKGTYSPTGVWGDPTLATREKGQALVEATVQEAVDQIKRLQCR